MKEEKVRVYALARELQMESKDLIALCHHLGYKVNNQLSSLDPDQRKALETMAKNPAVRAAAASGAPIPAVDLDQATAPPASAPPPPSPPATPMPTKVPTLSNKVPTLNRPPAPGPRPVPSIPPAGVPKAPAPVAPPPAPPAPVEVAKAPAPVAPPAPPVAPPAPPPAAPVAPAAKAPAPVAPPSPAPVTPAPAAPRPATPPAATPPTPAAKAPTPPPAAPPPPAHRPTPAAAAPPSPPPAPKPPPTLAAQGPGGPGGPGSGPRVPEMTGKVRNLMPPSRPRPILSPPRPLATPPQQPQQGGPAVPASPAAQGGEPPRPPERRLDRPGRPRPFAPPVIAAPPRPRGPLPAKPADKKPEEPAAQKPVHKFTPDMFKPGVTAEELLNRVTAAKEQEAVALAEPAEVDGEEGDDKGKVRPGAVPGRGERHKKRSQRAKTRRDDESPVRLRPEDEDDRPSNAARLRRMRQQQRPQGTQPRKGKVALEPPFTVRALSEALGLPAKDVMGRLMKMGQMVKINDQVDQATAELLALECGAEIEIKKPLDPEEKLLEDLQGKDKDDDLVPRAPVVTIMGHVDHGKTSLLDRIRESNVVATEAGGITQHLRAWRVVHNDQPITFLDTPGHEAFTQMRARGANVTDIVVLVVAADDGPMPQTEEAYSHAKAAGVPIVVAINKVDLPNANLRKTEQQLYGMGLLPDTMGGEAPFVHTVSTKDKARGIDELLESLALVAELRELKANPKKPGTGTCLEARVSGDEGIVATLLVQNGTLKRGDIVVCGTAFGRVRAMVDDLGRPLEEAGPTVPVRITGLDEAPNADDKFYVVPDLAMAREITEKRRERLRAAQPTKNATFRLEDLDKTKVAEIKLVLKADVRGSIEAIKKELEKLSHEEVRLNLLHTGIGAITESDVQLALASPADTLIVGFNVVPDERARNLADEKNIQVKQYDIIYKLTDDLKLALEGKLKPRENVVELGRAVVRQTFKISHVGTVAGCHVTKGVIERSARIRLIRDGVVIYPPPERSAGLESLKRIKDDVREVREGFECGIKIAGFDDVKVGDVIEAFKVEQVQRTL